MNMCIARRLKSILAKGIHFLGRPAQGEYRLIRDIWSGNFPHSQDQLPLSTLERAFITVLVAVRSLSFVHLADLCRKYFSGSAISELYVVSWFCALLLILGVHAWMPPLLVMILVSYRLIDGLNYRLCIIFVDRYKPKWGLRSLNRSLILLCINYFEIVVGFAILYLLTASIGPGLTTPITSRIDAVYFSVITITTLGYGDLHPITETGKWLCVAETLMGFVLVVLVLGTFLTGIRNIKNLEQAPNKDR